MWRNHISGKARTFHRVQSRHGIALRSGSFVDPHGHGVISHFVVDVMMDGSLYVCV